MINRYILKSLFLLGMSLISRQQCHVILVLKFRNSYLHYVCKTMQKCPIISKPIKHYGSHQTPLVLYYAHNLILKSIWGVILWVATNILWSTNHHHANKDKSYVILPNYLPMPLRSFLLDLGRFFSFLILYTVGRTPWTGDQPVARPLSTHRTTET
jgi:hypothetical protein